MSFWDTSALVKLYIPEPDCAAFAAIAASSGTLVVGAIVLYEARTVFRRRECEGVVPPGGAQVCYQKLLDDIRRGRFEMVDDSLDLEREFGDLLDRCFSAVPPVFVRAYDALHIAAARVVREAEFVSADIRQREAARRLGFSLMPPVYPVPP